MTSWSDGSLSWIPISCPPGIAYPRSAQAGSDPAVVRGEATVGLPVQPVDPLAQFRGAGVGYGVNCGLTQLKVSVTDAFGAPINGIRAIVDWDGRQDNPITTNPSGHIGYDAGGTDAILQAPGMVNNRWRVWLIDGNADRISEVVGFETNDDCTSGNAKQIVTVTFRSIR